MLPSTLAPAHPPINRIYQIVGLALHFGLESSDCTFPERKVILVARRSHPSKLPYFNIPGRKARDGLATCTLHHLLFTDTHPLAAVTSISSLITCWSLAGSQETRTMALFENFNQQNTYAPPMEAAHDLEDDLLDPYLTGQNPQHDAETPMFEVISILLLSHSRVSRHLSNLLLIDSCLELTTAHRIR